MNLLKALIVTVLAFVSFQSNAQRLVYSTPDKEDNRRMNFDIIGKVSGNFLIYKSTRGKHFITAYDNDMQQIAKEDHSFLPDDRLINVDFFPYAEHAYMVYQYQRRNVVYCNAVKVDGLGKKISEIITLDTSHIGIAVNNKIYAAISSEDKSQLLIYKINSRNRNMYRISTLLFDNELNLRKRSDFNMPMEERNDYISEFAVDNEGDLVFTKYTRTSNDVITKSILHWKQALSDNLVTTELNLEKNYLDEHHVKVDNANNRYFITSFYYKNKRGNIDGFYFFVWDKTTQKPVIENTLELSEELRREAKSDAHVKSAFNDYFIRNVIVRKDGGFLIGSESYYTRSRFNNLNRWDLLYGSPFGFNDYQMMSPMYNSWYWRNRFNNNQSVRHYADKLTILSFNKEGQLEWSNVIHKEQYDDGSGDVISYQLMNTGGQLHFIFNQEVKNAYLLNDFTLNADGKVTRNPTLKNLDRGYELLPKFGKQVSARQMIIPCYYRNYICFAKLEFNS